jgi:hypothetical protein
MKETLSVHIAADLPMKPETEASDAKRQRRSQMEDRTAHQR